MQSMKALILSCLFLFSNHLAWSDEHKLQTPRFAVKYDLFFTDASDESSNPFNIASPLHLTWQLRQISDEFKERMRLFQVKDHSLSFRRTGNEEGPIRLQAVVKQEGKKTQVLYELVFHVDPEEAASESLIQLITPPSSPVNTFEEMKHWKALFSGALEKNEIFKRILESDHSTILTFSLDQWNEKRKGNPLLLINFLLALEENRFFFRFLNPFSNHYLPFQDSHLAQKEFSHWLEEMRLQHASGTLTLEGLLEGYLSIVHSNIEASDQSHVYIDFETRQLIVRFDAFILPEIEDRLVRTFIENVYSSLNPHQIADSKALNLREYQSDFEVNLVLDRLFKTAFKNHPGRVWETKLRNLILRTKHAFLDQFNARFKNEITDEAFYDLLPHLRAINWHRYPTLVAVMTHQLRTARTFDQLEALLDPRLIDAEVLQEHPEIDQVLRRRMNEFQRGLHSEREEWGHSGLSLFEDFFLQLDLQRISFWKEWMLGFIFKTPRLYELRTQYLPGLESLLQGQRALKEWKNWNQRNSRNQAQFLRLLQMVSERLIETSEFQSFVKEVFTAQGAEEWETIFSKHAQQFPESRFARTAWITRFLIYNVGLDASKIVHITQIGEPLEPHRAENAERDSPLGCAILTPKKH